MGPDGQACHPPPGLARRVCDADGVLTLHPESGRSLTGSRVPNPHAVPCGLRG